MGGRGASAGNEGNKELKYYEGLKRLQQERLKAIPKTATVTRDAINNAINFADEKIKEIKNRRK